MRALNLREGQPLVGVSLTLDEVRNLHELGIARAEPESAGTWRVNPGSKVGAVRLGDLDVRIESKVPLLRLFWMLGMGRNWGRWFNEQVDIDQSDDLLSAIAQVFSTEAERTLARGVLKSYRLHQSAEPAIRGRWLVSEQLRKRQGLPLPAELQFDEYTADIAENALLRTASRRLLALPRVASSVRGRLQRVDRSLAQATLLTLGDALPVVTFDRRNEHYRPAVELAVLILEGLSLEHGSQRRRSSGYLLDMALVFEQFVEAMVGRAVRRWGGQVKSQESVTLDRAHLVRMQPDLVWRQRGAAIAILDAKYKAEKPAGYPNADIYQMLAYCVRYELSSGHLVYAAGNELAARYEVTQAGVTVVCHALQLDSSVSDIETSINAIVDAAQHAYLGSLVSD